MSKTFFSIDVERDLHTNTYEGVTKGLKLFEQLCDKYSIRPILFVTGDCIKKHPEIFKKLHKKGWEISSHGLTHRRFDELSSKEKEREIKESIALFKSKLGFAPPGFRAPQHSIDAVTLDLLERYKFRYDSSYTPLNALQFVFFPRKFLLNVKSFFSPLHSYHIRSNLREIPSSALGLPYVSLIVRILPLWILKVYVGILKLLYNPVVFYAHSWDFIPLPKSRIDRKFSHILFVKKLEELMKRE